MPLVRLEVENFKSYRGKQIIGPFFSFSAIIGPNGSGKSNLMDAVSFVLGVKSAQLRSTQLRDLIYRGRQMGGDDDGEGGEGTQGEGTATRASVTAVYRDNKGAEYRFQRTITTAGASEYRINNKVMSAATYNERLHSFNILVKAKNFLVFQGDVEAVASQGAKELSKLIDQISGSLEYKDEYERAKAAQDRAVENSTFTFNKRKGINAELKTFREQKSEAERFEKLQAERDAHVMQHILWRLYHIEEELEQNSTQIDDESAKLPAMRNQVRDDEKGVEAARKERDAAEKDIAKQDKAVRRREKDLENQQPGLDAFDEKMAHSLRKRERAEKLCEATKRDVDKYRTLIAKLKQDHETAKRAADEAAEEQRKAAEARGQTLSGQELAEYHELEQQANLRATAERLQLETLGRERRAQETTLRGLEQKLAALQRSQEKQQDIVDAQTSRRAAVSATQKDLDSQLKAAKAEVKGVQAQRDEIKRTEDKLNETLQTCITKLLQAGSAARETERETRMKNTFATLQRTFPGVRGRLVDLCKPTQRKYDTAIATVLGRNNDAVIVDTEKTAIDCIEYLRNQRAGQATFIPLETIQVKPINDRLRNIATGARLAVDVLQFDASIERAMHFACGNALVCDTIAIARMICYEKKQEVKAVTLDGTLIHKNGNMTGGVSGETRTQPWDDNEVAQLQRQRDTCMSELKELGKRRHELSRDDELQAKIGRIEAELAIQRDEMASIDSRLKGAKAELKVINEQLAQTQPKLAEAQQVLAASDARFAALTDTINAADDDVFAAFCARIGVEHIREYRGRQLQVLEREKDARQEFELQMKRLQHTLAFEESEFAKLNARLELNQRVVTKETERMAALTQEKAELQQQIEAIKAEIAELTKRLAELKEEAEEKKVALSNAKKAEAQASKALAASIKEISNWNDAIEKLNSERSSIYRRCRLDEIALPLTQGSLKNVPLEDNPDLAPMEIDEDVTQLAIQARDYGIEVDFDDLDEEEKENGGDEMARELQGRIDDVTSQIEQMQPNMKAIDRLDDAESKLKETERDFNKSRTEAQKARDDFNRIKKKRCDLFNAAFTHISERIDKVYKELTKGKASPMGGVAYLSLEDTEEPYLSGARYHIMPPMKRFRDMTDLSGGEKTMGALALLFAISSFKPAPFFFLDEVDAALDSQNVAKVANYIRAHASERMQFIVISLKASLYERAQALAGVYRDQAVGASATLTLELERYA